MQSDTNDLISTGKALFEKLHGQHTGEALVKAMSEVCPDFPDMVFGFAMEQVFNRDHIDLLTRELITIAVCTALGDMPEQVKAHIEAAKACGATNEQCVEAILQVVSLAGFPRVGNALIAAREVLQ